MQKNILDENPDLDIEIYVIWLPMVFLDFFPRLGRAVKTMPDERASHFWDKDRLIGTWFKENVTPQYRGEILWDASILFGSEARWDKRPKPVLHYGRTILQDADELKSIVEEMLRLED